MKKQKPPAFQFYVRDYETDENVKMMDLEHEGAYLRLMCNQWMEGSIPSDVPSLAKICRVPAARMAKLWPRIAPCFTAMKGSDRLHNTKLSAQKKERDAYSENARITGKLGAAKRWSDRVPMPTPLGFDSTATASATATAKQQKRTAGADEFSLDFLRAWAEYPRRLGGANKQGAWRAWQARLKEGVSPEAMIAGVKRYYAYCFSANSIGTQFVKQASTFFGKDRHYAEEWTPIDPAAKYKGGAAGSESETARAKEYAPPSAPRTGSMLKVADTPKDTSEDRRRVDEWSHAHPEEAATIHTECKTLMDVSFEGLGESARNRIASERYMQRVLAEKLTPKAHVA